MPGEVNDPFRFEAPVPGCTGKSSFAAFREADIRAKRMRQRGGSVVEAYRCRHCQQYHIGGKLDDGRLHMARDQKRRVRRLAEDEAEA